MKQQLGVLDGNLERFPWRLKWKSPHPDGLLMTVSGFAVIRVVKDPSCPSSPQPCQLDAAGPGDDRDTSQRETLDRFPGAVGRLIRRGIV